MWSHRFESAVDVPPETIWPVIANVAGWAEVDRNIDRIEIDGTPGPGTRFRLKPRGGPVLAFEIRRFEAPHVYSDVCRLPLARMETTHTLIGGAAPKVRVEIAIHGPLATLWGWLVGRRHAAGLPDQTSRILERARSRPTVPASTSSSPIAAPISAEAGRSA